MIYFKFFHLLAVLIWIGGMFFAYFVLRLAAVEILQAPERLRLWNSVFRRFFNWVWGSIGMIFVTGLYMVYQYGGALRVAHSIQAMLLLGILMACVFVYVFFACYVPLSLHVDKGRWQEAGEFLGKIRQLVALNLVLGLLTLSVAKLGLF